MQELAKQFINIMPSVLITLNHCVGDQVVYCPFDLDNPLFGIVTASHSYRDSTRKYDIELHGPEGQTTRIYNVDGAFVKSKADYYESIKGEEFRIASLPLRKFMQHYHNPHASVIVTSNEAELLEGVQVAPNHLPIYANGKP